MDINNILSMLGNNPQLSQSLMQMMSGGKGGGKMDNSSIMSILPQLFANQKATPTGQPTNGQSTEQQNNNQQSQNFSQQSQTFSQQSTSNTQHSSPTYTVHNMPNESDDINYTLFKLSQE